MALSFINTSGNIISEDFCSQLLIETKADYIKSKSFGGDVKKVDEDIATTFELLRERWEEIRSRILEDQFDTTQLRDRWIKPFLSLLGFDPVYIPHNLKNDAGIEYHIPYRGWNADDAPLIHMVQSAVDLDHRDKNNRTHPNKSPHDLLQQYLNTSQHSWAMLINGRKVRILRDFFHSITKGFIEFDIESIFESASTEQFRILYRMLHSSRFVGQYEKQKDAEEPQTCLLEKFHTLSRETGVKVGDNLRKQVRIAIETLGNGFAENLNPDDFDDTQEKKFYSETLNIIYRLLFLLFAEQKGWLPVKNDIYARTYSINALRERAERADYSHDNNEDLWEGLKVTFRLVTKGYTFPNGESINAFGGQLFSDERIFHIRSPLKNKHLLKAINALCFFEDKKAKLLKTKINYATLAIDELGSVYESLLDYEPRLLKENTEINGRNCKRGEFVLDDRSTERKTTGSYYTDSRLVAQLIDSALVPVIENAIKDKVKDDEKRAAILDLKVADIACGSGAFLIAALEKMGEYLSLIGKEEGEKPTEQELRHAKREILQNCIYGVDLNPMALELAKFSLWITASMPNFPLSFLDHKLKCGNSLVGATPELIDKGIPAEAFNPVTLDDKSVCADLKKRVKKELEGLSRKDKGIQTGLEFKVTVIDSEEEAEQYLHILQSEQEDAEEVENVALEYQEVYKALRENTEWKLADTWTAAFFIQKDDLEKIYPTNITLQNIKQGNAIDEDLETKILALARKYRFFHWHLEYPEVFDKARTENGRSGGFDCILGNPPWERVKLQEKEFFGTKNNLIATTSSKPIREKLIKKLKAEVPALYSEYLKEKDLAEKIANFLTKSMKYPLLGRGDVNTYMVFTECFRQNLSAKGHMGIIVPTGIATDDTTKFFFEDIVEKSNLITLTDYINKFGLFHDVHKSFKFCLLTISGYSHNRLFKFQFYVEKPVEVLDVEKQFYLAKEDLLQLNPNTKNCPVFRFKKDAEITKKIYSRNLVLINELNDSNPYDITFSEMFHMTNDAHLFFTSPKDADYPLYEGKMVDIHDYKFASIEINERNVHRSANSVANTIKEKCDKSFEPIFRYWVDKNEVDARIPNWYKEDWFIVFQKVTSPTNKRTFITSVIPKSGVGASIPVIFSKKKPELKSLLYANLSTFVFDYVVRQKVGGINIAFFLVKQLPIITPKKYSDMLKIFINERVLKLIYFGYSLKQFAKDIGYDGEPFTWDEEERFQLKCELDAIYGHLYSLTREEFDYILETFPIVKRKDMEKYGTYRTKDTILKLYDEMDWVKEEMMKV
jgi:hypothetical protein